MSKVLVVEDSRVFAALIKKKLESELKVGVDCAASYAEAGELLDENGSGYFMALLDLDLPDAPNGEIVDFVLSKGIPAAVFTGELSDDVRDTIWSKRIIDYVLKESVQNLDYITSLVKRIRKNRCHKVMVVDDSLLTRNTVGELLAVHQYQVFKARNGEEALEILEKNPDMTLAVIDFNMPGMDGFELIARIRRKHSKERMAIVGLSAHGNNIIAARFLKKGANDYINKPFLAEEFYCRISQCVELIEYIAMARECSYRDDLTNLHNRRYFFEAGQKLFAASVRNDSPLAVAMIDMDNFKAINDRFGHSAGDEALIFVADFLDGRFRASDVVARFGGEEFCILAANMDPEKVVDVFEELRLRIQNTPATVAGYDISFTVSIGICRTRHESLERMLAVADECMYQAKRTGKNKVVVDTLESAP